METYMTPREAKQVAAFFNQYKLDPNNDEDMYLTYKVCNNDGLATVSLWDQDQYMETI